MTPAVLLPLLLAVQTAPDDQPALRLSVWPRSFVSYGEPVHVSVDARRDGFLTVLRVDTYDRVHVLFPSSPDDETFVRGGRRLTLRDRWGNDAFAAFERDGGGTILAALSRDPYDFSDVPLGGYASYSAMGLGYAGTDHLASLVQLVGRLAGNDDFEYAVATYWVHSRFGFFSTNYLRNASCFGVGRLGFWRGWPLGWDRLYGWHWPTGAYYYDPFDPFGYDAFYSPYGCYGTGFATFFPIGRPVIGRPGLPVDRDGFKRKKGGIVKPLEPRRREPATEGGVATRGREIDLKPVKRVRVDRAGAGDGTGAWRERGRATRDAAGGSRGFTKRVGGGRSDPSWGGRSGGGVDRGKQPAQRPSAARPERRSSGGGGSSKPSAERPREKPKN